MDLDDLRKSIHNRWNWTRENYPNLKETGAMAKALHVQTHLASGVGKLAGYLGRHQHGSTPKQDDARRQLMLTLTANLLLDTLELANLFEIKTEDLSDEIARIQASRLT